MNGNDIELRVNPTTSIVALASTFYTAALEEPLKAALAKLERNDSVACVPYNQLNTFLLNPMSLLPSDTPARVLVLLRIEDFIRLELGEHDKVSSSDSRQCLSVLRLREAEFLDIISHMRQLQLTVLLCPAGRGAYDTSSLANAIRITEHKITASLKAQQKHLILNWRDLEKQASASDLFNPAGDRLGHVPFSPEGLAAVAEFLAQRLNQMPMVTLSPSSDVGETTDFGHFLASLRVGLTIAPLTSETEEASVGLMRHTTHFITHPADKSSPERPLALLAAAPQGEAWSLAVDDRFGHYGTSGAVVFRFDTNIMRIAFLFLTCPVLGRQVEHAMFYWLAEVAEHRNAEFIQIPVLPGRDNKVLSELLQQLGAEVVRDNPSATQSNGAATQFVLCVSNLKDAVKRIAPNPVALSTIITNMNHGATTYAR